MLVSQVMRLENASTVSSPYKQSFCNLDPWFICDKRALFKPQAPEGWLSFPCYFRVYGHQVRSGRGKEWKHLQKGVCIMEILGGKAELGWVWKDIHEIRTIFFVPGAHVTMAFESPNPFSALWGWKQCNPGYDCKEASPSFQKGARTGYIKGTHTSAVFFFTLDCSNYLNCQKSVKSHAWAKFLDEAEMRKNGTLHCESEWVKYKYKTKQRPRIEISRGWAERCRIKSHDGSLPRSWT